MTYQDQTPLLPIYGGRIDCYAISCFRHCKEENRIFSPNPYKITLSGFYFPAVATRWRWSGECCYGGHYRPLSEAKSGRRAHQEGQFPGLRARERIVSQWGRPSISFCGPLVVKTINTVTHRGGRIPGVFNRRATRPAGMDRQPNAIVSMVLATKGSRRNNFTGEGPIISSWGCENVKLFLRET
jgi:hypothetical protein